VDISTPERDGPGLVPKLALLGSYFFLALVRFFLFTSQKLISILVAQKKWKRTETLIFEWPVLQLC
jgi:hypothetical protein